MTHDKGNQPLKNDGLTGTDKQQDSLTDDRHGAYDPVVPPAKGEPLKQHPTTHEAAQGGADVRAPTTPPDQCP